MNESFGGITSTSHEAVKSIMRQSGDRRQLSDACATPGAFVREVCGRRRGLRVRAWRWACASAVPVRARWMAACCNTTCRCVRDCAYTCKLSEETRCTEVQKRRACACAARSKVSPCEAHGVHARTHARTHARMYTHRYGTRVLVTNTYLKARFDHGAVHHPLPLQG